MLSPLIRRVDKWFSDPHEYPLTQESIREWVFMAAVEQLGVGLRCREDWKRIHNFLTYLLLGWNPVTARIDAHIAVSDGERLWSPEFVVLIKQLLNFEKPVSISNRYSLMRYFTQFASQLTKVETTITRAEEFTLTIMMLWLTTRRVEIDIPQDIVAVRACLDLYQRGRGTGVSTMDVEYTRNQPMFYSAWIQQQLQRLLVMDNGLEELCNEISYMAWFACLVRVNRMSVGTNNESIRTMLSNHVEKMYEFLDKFPLIAVDENDDKSARKLSLWKLIKP